MSKNKNMAGETAQKLLEIEAVQFSFDKPFVWSSGWNSPIYCDIRLSLSYPLIRSFIKTAFVDLIRQHFPQTQIIAGVATAGIPQAALIAETMQLPLVYVRSSVKTHGKENLIEGKILKGQKTLIIEDVISTGQSSIKVAQAMQEAGFEVLGIAAVFTYGFDKTAQLFEDSKIALQTLSDYNTLLIELFKKQDLGEKTMASLHEWRKNPEAWKIK